MASHRNISLGSEHGMELLAHRTLRSSMPKKTARFKALKRSVCAEQLGRARRLAPGGLLVSPALCRALFPGRGGWAKGRCHPHGCWHRWHWWHHLPLRAHIYTAAQQPSGVDHPDGDKLLFCL